MSVLDRLPSVLPPVIPPQVGRDQNPVLGVIAPVVKEVVQEVKQEVKQAFDIELEEPSAMKFLIVTSRDLTEDEKRLLLSYGKILFWDDCHVNLDVNKVVADMSASYVIFDVRQKSHRVAINHQDTSKFHIVALVNSWEKEEDFVDDVCAENVLSTLPQKQAFRDTFNKLLLQKKIRAPSCGKMVLRVLLKALTGWQSK